MKLSDILKVENISNQAAFILGMIYARPIITTDGKILAYSAYKKGPRSVKVKKDIDEYYNLHLEKLRNFLGDSYNVELNKNIKKSHSFKKGVAIQNGVSVVIDNDLNISENADPVTYLYGVIEKWLIDADEKYKKIFLMGALDARASLDFTANYFSMDIIEETPLLVKRKLSKYNDIIGAVFNYNPRLVQKKSFKKNDQFRLKIPYYMGKFGLFTPFKIDYYKIENKEFEEKMLFGVFFLDSNFGNTEKLEKSISNRNLKINNLAIKLKEENLSDEAKREIIEKWREEHITIETDDELIHSSQNVKELSKRNIGYVCEYNNKHKTFTAKSNNENYVEAHHLIPFSKRKEFNVSIDIVENIVCLCPECHRRIHLAVDSERLEFIADLFKDKKPFLEKVGIATDLQQVFDFYGVKDLV